MFKTPTLRKATRRRMTRLGLITGNLLLVAAVVYLVVAPSAGSATAPATGQELHSNAATPQLSALDQLASASIAQAVATMTGIPEVIPITNQADSERASLNQASLNDDALAFKPQVIESAYKSNKDIQTYVVQAGDSISSIADKFGVTSNSIRWSNDLTGNEVKKGKKLLIPPVNGIVYKVKAADTPQSLADYFNISRAKIVQYNDAEIKGLTIGELIILPGATREEAATATAASYQYQPYYGSFRYGYNGYDPGWCTWYVANRINVPVGWGNANTWDNRARMTPGWTVSSHPRVGAIAQTDRGWAGHVAVVEDVSANGSMIKYSDMNGLAGFNAVGYSGWVPASKFPNYIYR